MVLRMKSATSDGEALARAAISVAGEAARRLQLPTPMLVRVGNSAVFRCGDSALRVGRQGSDCEVAVRLSPQDRATLLEEKGASVFEPMPGRAMKEYVVLPDSWRKQPAKAKR